MPVGKVTRIKPIGRCPTMAFAGAPLTLREAWPDIRSHRRLQKKSADFAIFGRLGESPCIYCSRPMLPGGAMQGHSERMRNQSDQWSPQTLESTVTKSDDLWAAENGVGGLTAGNPSSCRRMSLKDVG